MSSAMYQLYYYNVLWLFYILLLYMYYHKCIILHMIINVLITMYYHKCNITMYFHKCIITVKILYESRIRWKHEYKWRCEEWIRWSLAALLKTWSEKEFEHSVGGAASWTGWWWWWCNENAWFCCCWWRGPTSVSQSILRNLFFVSRMRSDE